MNNMLINDPLFPQQWHLNETSILEAWSIATGNGVVIGIVDDGLQYTHPDLNNQYRVDLSYDFVDNDQDPSPENVPDFLEDVINYIENPSASIPNISNNLTFHGTAVAGIALAEGNNGVGVSGVAYNADLAAIRIETNAGLNLNNFDAQLANALSFNNQDIDIYNNSWKINLSLIPLGAATYNSIQNSIANGRGGLGSIYVFAAGNDGEDGGNVNYDGFANSRYSIAVGAIDRNGVRSTYSNPGASLLISAYGNDENEGLITTNLQGEDQDYTDFTGTSAAAPIVSGIIALMLESNPNLTWRDVQHILVETATQNDPNNPDWTANGAGYLVNHNYGFGAINADAAVNAALNWQPVAEEVGISSEIINVNNNIPDNNPIGFTSPITITDNLKIEWIEIVTDSDLVNDDLEVILTSPNGTSSILSPQGSGLGINDNNFISDWTFTSARHWGESSAGEWSLTVIDHQASSSEIFWDDWQINFYGTSDTISNSLDNNNITQLQYFPNDSLTEVFVIPTESHESEIPISNSITSSQLQDLTDNFFDDDFLANFPSRSDLSEIMELILAQFPIDPDVPDVPEVGINPGNDIFSNLPSSPDLAETRELIIAQSLNESNVPAEIRELILAQLFNESNVPESHEADINPDADIIGDASVPSNFYSSSCKDEAHDSNEPIIVIQNAGSEGSAQTIIRENEEIFAISPNGSNNLEIICDQFIINGSPFNINDFINNADEYTRDQGNVVYVSEDRNTILIRDFENNSFFTEAVDPNIDIVEITEDSENITTDNAAIRIGDDLVVSTELLGDRDSSLESLGWSLANNNSEDTSSANNFNFSEGTVYRFFNNNAQVPFYTGSETEIQFLDSNLNFSFEGAAHLSGDSTTTGDGALPVYRFINQNTNTHFYTIGEQERNILQNDIRFSQFVFDRANFSAYNLPIEGTVPVYRFSNSTTGVHFFTSLEEEKNILENDPFYALEGIAYHVFPV